VGLIRRDHPDADRGRRPARAGARRVVPPRRHGRRRAISFAASTIPGFRCWTEKLELVTVRPP